MNGTSTLDDQYSTTRSVTRQQPVFEKQTEDKFETVLFLPVGEARQGEGGLRTQGYFKARLEGKPLITVVTVVFNGEEFLEETIQSIINQTYDNVEYIIIDGGSTDGTLDIIRKYEHAIDYWVSEKDKGIYDAMNKGIKLATGDWVNFMNAGDSFFSIGVIQNINEQKKFHTKRFGIYGKGKWIHGKRAFPFVVPLLLKMPNHQAMFVSVPWIIKNRFDLNFKISSDLDQKMKIWKDGGFEKISSIVALCLEGGVSQSSPSVVKEEHLKIRRKYFL
jgi:hypothetical protein